MASDRDTRALEAAIMFGDPRLSGQAARQAAGARTFGFFSSLGGVFKKAVGVATAFIPGQIDDRIAAGLGLGPGPAQQAIPFPFPIAASPGGCPPGQKIVNGRCVDTGFRGAIERFVPGGSPGALTDQFGEAVIGAFNRPALEPAQVGTIMRRDGSVGSLLRCPRGMLLGIDNLCYGKGDLPAKFRKWKKEARGPISARDWKAVKTFDRVQSRVKSIAQDSGFTCRKK